MEKVIKTAAKMYNHRDMAKRYYGDKYQEQIKPYMDLIKGVMKEHRLDEIKAMMRICQDETIKQHGWTVVLLTAAAVEIAEPSQP